ncbi:MAG TPA: ATP-dependent zinc metalloprotease FtsH [Erysipelothrix sp.]|jgi:cell division protease FtsH|nr:ATP-dependent zinc metalloprotease FtsH [Erysipelothrix sp.]
MKKTRLSNFIPYIVVILFISLLMQLQNQQEVRLLNYTELVELSETQTIENVSANYTNLVIDVDGEYREGGETKLFRARIANTDENSQFLQEEFGNLNVVDPYENNTWISILAGIVPYIIMMGLIFFMFSRMGGGNKQAFDFSKSPANRQENINVKFDDVAGAEEEKEEMQELIEYLKSPKKFEKMGARIPKGILLVGPPGTGKTLLAKAAAGEANVPYYSISGSDFVEMFVGVGASRVRDMFKQAKKTAPCIIFIDEIDAVGRQRGAGLGGGHDEREQTLNQLLVEMDGIDDNSGVLIIAATNRGDILDPALLRPGRFDRTIQVSLPDKKGREAILHVHARNKVLDETVSLGNLASRTPGFSGADLENVLNEAAILAVRESDTKVRMHHLDEAVDRVMAGPAKKSRTYSDKEKKLVAYHETGHTIIGLKLESASEVQKVTIIPRGQAGGYNLMTPKEETYFQTKSDLIGMITGLLGGRVAEEIVFDEISTGAYNDIERATKIARNMVMSYGMSALGTIQYEDAGNNVFLGRDYGSNMSYSGEVAYEIDREIRKIIDEAYENAKRIITENRDLLDKIAETLMEYETLTKEQIEELASNQDMTLSQQQVLNQ